MADIVPGPDGSEPFYLTAAGSLVFFIANDGAHGTEVWRSDGTEAGTFMVKDIAKGPSSSDPNSFIDVGDMVFFKADDGIHGRELWRSDGTQTGTRMVADINPGPRSALGFDVRVTDVEGTLYFPANDGVHGDELWRTDGKRGGTRMVADIRPGWRGSFPFELSAATKTLYFAADDGEHGQELWRTDGTAAGTRLVADIRRGPGGSLFFLGGMAAGPTVYFEACTGRYGCELWRSDGTAGGTRLVRDINTMQPECLFTDAGRVFRKNACLSNLIGVGGTLFFAANDGGHGRELWRSDGTREGTKMVTDLNPGGQSSLVCCAGLVAVAVGGTLFFVATDGIHGDELWRTDGMPADTHPVATSGSLGPDMIARVGGQVFFAGPGGLWSTDGTPAGTKLVGSFEALGGLTNVRGTLFFAADDGIHGDELWAV